MIINDDTYIQIETLYKSATGEARKAYSNVLDIICDNTQIHSTGYWIFEAGKIPKCSICGKYSDDADEYGDAICCPFCGSSMKYI